MRTNHRCHGKWYMAACSEQSDVHVERRLGHGFWCRQVLLLLGNLGDGHGGHEHHHDHVHPACHERGIHYLRVMTQDAVGNDASWVTLYVFKYDSTPPSNPTSPCVQTNGTTTNGTWQRLLSEPTFTWSGASDTASGVARYYYYWGTSIAGTSISFVTSQGFDPPTITAGVYYLRV